MLTRLRLALALALFSCASAPAIAADCVQGTGTANKGQCYPPFVPIDPTTGQPVGPGGGGTSGAVYGPDNAGTAPQKPPIFTGGKDTAGNLQPFRTTPAGDQYGYMPDGNFPTFGALADTASCVPGTSHLACQRQIDADLKAPTPAGSFVIGKVGVDQSQPGTSDAVTIKPRALTFTTTDQTLAAAATYSVAADTTIKYVKISVKGTGAVLYSIDATAASASHGIPLNGGQSTSQPQGGSETFEATAVPQSLTLYALGATSVAVTLGR